jgi:peptidase E
MEPENPLLDEYFLKQTGKRNPAVCLLPTASGDSDTYIVTYYDAFNRYHCRPDHLSLFFPPANIEAFLLSHDAIYVGGGNTKSMLALWREWGLDRILRRAWRRGIVLGGVSAGSICWFEEGLTDSISDKLTRLECLGLLRGSNCPHYDSEEDRRPVFRRLVGGGRMKPGVAAEDGVALHYVGRRLKRVVASRPDAAAYRVRPVRGALREEKITPAYLG